MTGPLISRGIPLKVGVSQWMDCADYRIYPNPFGGFIHYFQASILPNMGGMSLGGCAETPIFAG